MCETVKLKVFLCKTAAMCYFYKSLSSIFAPTPYFS